MKIPEIPSAPGAGEGPVRQGGAGKHDAFEALLRKAEPKRKADTKETEGLVHPPVIPAAPGPAHLPVLLQPAEAALAARLPVLQQASAKARSHGAQAEPVLPARLQLAKHTEPAELRRLAAPVVQTPAHEARRMPAAKKQEPEKQQGVMTEPSPNVATPAPAPTTVAATRELPPPAAPLPLPQADHLPAPAIAWNPSGARLRIDTGEAGPLAVRIELREGTADLQVRGAAAPILGGHAAELRVALATEGLRLGNLDTGTAPGGSGAGNGNGSGDGRNGAQHDRHQPPAPSGNRPPQQRPGRRRGTIDVEA